MPLNYYPFVQFTIRYVQKYTIYILDVKNRQEKGQKLLTNIA